MPDFDAKVFEIDSALELVADHFNVETPDSTLFQNASPTDRITLKAGLLNALDQAILIGQIEQGVVDEYELTITPTDITGRLRGRDPSALILDRHFEQVYIRPMEKTAEAVLGNQTLERIVSEPPDEEIPIKTGHFKASDIARDAVASVGLTLSWEARDYEILSERVEIRGRVIDTLRSLIQPWTLVEPFKADIYLDGQLVIIRHRQLPSVRLSPMYTFELRDARRSTVTVRKRRLRKVGKLTLRGARIPQAQTEKPAEQQGGGAGFFAGGEQSVTLEHASFDEAGTMLEKTVEKLTFRLPDRILLRATKETYTQGDSGPLTLSLRETTQNTWETSFYDENGPVNQPKMLRQFVRQEGIHPDDPDQIFRTLETDETTYSYDHLGFEKGETTIKKKLDLEINRVVNNEMVCNTLHDLGPLMAERITEQYGFNLDALRWIIRKRDSVLGGGHRPGGPGRGSSTAGAQPGEVYQQVELVTTISSDPDAEPISFSNENMTLADLQFILAQFQAAEGLFEYEVAFGGVAMPWIKRGITIQFVNIVAEDGVTLIPIPVLLVTEVRSRYDESDAGASFMADLRAFGWGA